MSEKQNPSDRTWVPLESDPEILQQVSLGYGVADCQISDLYSDEPALVPQPLEAILVLYTILEETSKWLLETFPVDTSQADMFHMPQRIHNACGTYALLHAFLNLRVSAQLLDGSPLQAFAKQWETSGKELTSEQYAQIFEAVSAFETIHGAGASEGTTDGEAAMSTDVHYISFIRKHDTLWLLDGQLAGPLNCGPCTSADELLAKTWVIVQKIFELTGDKGQFAALAISGI